MDRFSILLKKSVSPKEKIPKTIEIQLPIPPVGGTGEIRTSGRVSTVYYSDYDRRPEGINVQTIHPVDGDLVIISIPLANSLDLNQFREVIEERIENLGIHCGVIVSSY